MSLPSSDLRLVDFTNAAPSTLQTQVINAIDDANSFLDNLTAGADNSTGIAKLSAEQALESCLISMA